MKSQLPVGESLPNWTPRPAPPHTAMTGRHCRVEPLDPRLHAADLYAAYSEDHDNVSWTYLPYGPFPGYEEFYSWATQAASQEDPLFYAIIPNGSGKAEGIASYLRISPPDGVIEVGHINFSPRLQKTAAATEAMYLMMNRVFEELGYRRYEWKCDALNSGSRAAAQRLGFHAEGIFRQATIYKGRNRDTAWFSLIDRDWPEVKNAMEQWLSPDNFDVQERQKLRLSDLIVKPHRN
ncbi:MAG: GNAT family protein [Verrucomicrobiales bacterium]|nr:GNAT family protein [Verrucomicrobiales bacterium]